MTIPVRMATVLALVALMVLPMLMMSQSAGAQVFPGNGEYGGGGGIPAFIAFLLALIFAILRSIFGSIFGAIF